MPTIRRVICFPIAVPVAAASLLMALDYYICRRSVSNPIAPKLFMSLFGVMGGCVAPTIFAASVLRMCWRFRRTSYLLRNGVRCAPEHIVLSRAASAGLPLNPVVAGLTALARARVLKVSYSFRAQGSEWRGKDVIAAPAAVETASLSQRISVYYDCRNPSVNAVALDAAG